MNKWTLLTIAMSALLMAQIAISYGPRVRSEHVPGVGIVVWQDGSSRRWIIFPGEKCER